jgi:hypothetical protein
MEERSTSKLMTIAVVVPLQHAVLLGGVFLTCSFMTFLFFLIFLPLMSFFLLTYVSRERQSFKALTQLMWLALLVRNSTGLIDELIIQRKELKLSIDALAKQFLTERNEVSIIEGINKRDVFAAKRIDGI